MIHPLLRLVATQPHLLADHVQAYAGLVSEEVGQAVDIIKLRVAYLAVAGVTALLAILFAGIALMLWGAVPSSNMPMPWMLVAVPGVLAVVAVVCVFAGRRPPSEAFTGLKQQVQSDLGLIREASAA